MEVLSAKELRIGNYYYYTCKDFLDERKEWDEVCQIDAQDLVWLESNPNDKDFKPIPLTEEWLNKFGFKKDNNLYTKDFCGGLYSLQLNLDYNGTHFTYYDGYVVLDFIHKLQNLYFALTGEELTINQ